MALISCPECLNQISDQSSFCIHCGFPIQTVQSNSVLQKDAPSDNEEISIYPELQRNRDEQIRKYIYRFLFGLLIGLGLLVSYLVFQQNEQRSNVYQRSAVALLYDMRSV